MADPLFHLRKNEEEPDYQKRRFISKSVPIQNAPDRKKRAPQPFLKKALGASNKKANLPFCINSCYFCGRHFYSLHYLPSNILLLLFSFVFVSPTFYLFIIFSPFCASNKRGHSALLYQLLLLLWTPFLISSLSSPPTFY